MWGTIIINFCYNYFVFYDMKWMPDYLKNNHHLSFRMERLITFASFMGIAIVALASGWAADLMIKRGMDKVIVRKAFVIGGLRSHALRYSEQKPRRSTWRSSGASCRCRAWAWPLPTTLHCAA